MVDKDNEGPKVIKSVDELIDYLSELEFFYRLGMDITKYIVNH